MCERCEQRERDEPCGTRERERTREHEQWRSLYKNIYEQYECMYLERSCVHATHTGMVFMRFTPFTAFTPFI